MNRKLRDVLILVACLALICIPSFGQTQKGSLAGTVTDQQGAVVPNAQIKVTNTSTGVAMTSTTDSAGSFRFNLIPAGEYKLEAAAPNFKTSVQSGIIISAGHDTGVGIVKLTVGAPTTTVEVTSEAPLMDTAAAQVTNTFSGVTLSTFAGVQENEGLDNLALFVPGVSAARDNGFSNTNGGTGFSVNGLRGRNNDQQIDGQNNNDNSVGGPGLFVSDAEFVSQYVLITNQFGPEYGRNAGSVVNIVTKSGGNAWHGSVFGSENNSILNSLNNFQKNTDICGDSCLTKPPRLNDEFGGFTIGGPLVKNKAFFFGGFDEEITSQKGQFNSSNLTPTPAGLAALAACFPASTSLQALQSFGPFGISAGNPTVIVPDGGLKNSVAACPLATFGGVSRTVSQPVHVFDWILKTDVQLGKDTIMGRYLFNRGNFFNLGDNGAAGYFFNVPALSQAALISWTRNLNAHMVNEARVSFGRLNVEFGGNSFGTEPVAGQLDQAVTNVSFSTGGLLGFGPATNLPQQRIVNTWQAQDNWNYVMGKHQLKAGVNWTYQRSPNIFLPTINGAFRFTNWTSFMNNTPNRVRVALGPSLLDFREYDTFAYGGDDWKIRQNLTIQLGVTWSYYGQPANIFNQITTAQQTGSAPFWNPALPLTATTTPTIPAPKNSFGPSVGFTYSPQWGGFLTGGPGKTTIRGGYRMLYDPPFYNIYLNVSTSAPEVFLNSVPAPATHPLPAVPTGPNVRASLSPFLTKGVFDPRTFAETHVTPNFGPDKVQSWTLGMERELSKNSAIEIRYAGNHAYNLFQTLNQNPLIGPLKADFPNLVPAGLTPCAASQLVGPGAGVALGRANCDQGVSRLRSNTGYSNYNALQAEFRANNLFKQLTVRSSYTFSKNLDNVSEIFSTFGGGNTSFVAQNPANANAPGEYSFSGLDYPHQWSITFAEQLPFYKEQHGLAGHLFGGWGLSANYLIASGQRYTPAQLFMGSILAQFGLEPDYYDIGFFGNFNSGVEALRPFLGKLSAPASAVGVMAGDACNILDSGAAPTCALAPTTLLSMNAMGPNCLSAPLPCAVVPVTNTQVRYIINSQTSQAVFGTPFGNAPRNPAGATDAISNIANVGIFKSIKLGEHANFEFRTTLLNALNHNNFTSVDPFVDDAGLTGAFNGFGTPSMTPSISRRIIFGGKLTF